MQNSRSDTTQKELFGFGKTLPEFNFIDLHQTLIRSSLRTLKYKVDVVHSIDNLHWNNGMDGRHSQTRRKVRLRSWRPGIPTILGRRLRITCH
jgi:hypothetical protein